MPPTATFDLPRTLPALVAAAVLAAAVLWAVDHFVGWPVVLAVAREVAPSEWIAFAALLALSYTSRVLRLWRLLHDIDPGLRMGRVAPVFFVHNALASLLPARLGEVAMPLLARRWLAVDWAAAVGALAWWRISDLAIFAALALSLLAAGAAVLAPLYAAAFVACGMPFVVFALRPRLRAIVAARAAVTAHPRAHAMALRILDGMPARGRAFAADLSLACLAWSTKLAGFAVLIHGALAAARPASAPLPSWPLLAAAGLAGDAGGALPLPTLGGIGPFEAGVGLGLTALGVDATRALAIGVTLHGAVLASIVGTGVLALAAGLYAARHRHTTAPCMR